MGWLEQFVAQTQAATNAAMGRIADALGCLVQIGNDNAAASIGTARSLAYLNGTPPDVGSPANLSPRSMLHLPAVFDSVSDGAATEQRPLDVLEQLGRYACAGWIANTGDDAFNVVLVGASGASTPPINMPAAASFQLPCIVAAVVIVPVNGKAAHYQAVLS